MKKPDELKSIAKNIRKKILKIIAKAGSGHPGGSLSATDIATVLYFHKMKHDPKNPLDPDRDRFVLSKGHASPLLYTCLAEAGYFDKKVLDTLRRPGSPLHGHPEYGALPGIEASTGSLGQGLSIANGIAYAGILDKKDYRVYCLIGDGESQEGQIWEAAMTSAKYKLHNVVGILDNNCLQIDGKVCDVKDIEPIKEKWVSFGWHVIEIDGHNIEEIIKAFDDADNVKDKPVIIIAHTIKGKGVPFMENDAGWHGKAPDEEQLKKALDTLY